MPKSNTHRICAKDQLFHTHGHKVFTDRQTSRIKYNYYINNVLLELGWLSRKQNSGRLHKPQESNLGSASPELLVEEFHSIFIF
jgi:hypothetical protein